MQKTLKPRELIDNAWTLKKARFTFFYTSAFLLQLHIVAVGWFNDEHGGDGGCNINTIYRLFVRNKLFYVRILFCEIVQISTV